MQLFTAILFASSLISSAGFAISSVPGNTGTNQTYTTNNQQPVIDISNYHDHELNNDPNIQATGGTTTSRSLEKLPSSEGGDKKDSTGDYNDPTGCLSRYNAYAEDCENKATEAAGACDQNSSQNQSSFGTVTSMAAGITQSLGAATAASIQLACSQVGRISTAANGVLAAFRMRCSGSMSSCINSCQQYIQSVTSCLQRSNYQSELSNYTGRAQTNLNTCNGYTQAVAQANQSLQQTVASAQNAANCQQASAADYCTAHPDFDGCRNANLIASCDNAQFAATNVTCQCMRNPSGPNCGQVLGTAATPTAQLPGGVIAQSNTSANGVDLSGLTEEGGPAAVAGNRNGNGEELSGQKGGSGAAGGGSGNLKGGAGGQKNAANGGKEKGGLMSILSGFWGGSGSGSGSGSSGGYESQGGRGGGRGYGSNQVAMPDLRKFLPGGANDPRRGIAGGGVDGIQGQNVNLFQIIKNAYIKQSKSLRD